MRAESLRRAFGAGLASALLVACAGYGGAGPGRSTDGRAADTLDPTHPSRYAAPAGERLDFSIRDGRIRNYFHRQGPAAAHLLARSGSSPRLIAAFPANNQGIGVWFTDAPADTELWAESASGSGSPDAALTGLIRAEGDRRAIGVRARIRSNARALAAHLFLLGNVRTLRDYGYGLCLEDAARFPALRNETMELLADGRVARIRREQIGDRHAMELLLAAQPGTRLALVERRLPARPGCDPSPGPRRVLELSGANGVAFELIALSDEEPLTPFDTPELFAKPLAPSADSQALAFLSYREKLVAGSWRFLTYFGRDTLLSLRLLLPVLGRDVAFAALGSVVERIHLPNDSAPGAPSTIDRGEVAHEEEIGDYAAWKNSLTEPPPRDLRTPRYDYKMIDGAFLLAPVLAELVGDDIRAQELEAFLARRRSDGRSYREAVEANLDLVLTRARPFAEDPSAPARKKHKLVALKDGHWVGQWRDSEMGLAFGRYPFDVNAALVPSALAAAARLYTALGRAERAREAEQLARAWGSVEELFRIDLPVRAARENVAAYARALGVADTSALVTGEPDGIHRYYGIALDARGAPIPVHHSDHGFVMEFARPSDDYLLRAATTIERAFPAGLISDVGLLVASPAFASPDIVIDTPASQPTAQAGERVPLRDLFTPSHYHGAVVWSWQQALLASGLRRQLARNDLNPRTRSALENAECRLWSVLSASRDARLGELWSWQPDAQGRLVHRAFGDLRADADESNAIQLWSTVFLAVEPPSPEQNPRCR